MLKKSTPILCTLFLLFILQTVSAQVYWNGNAANGTGIWKVFKNIEGDGTITVENDSTEGAVWKFYKPAGSHRTESHAAKNFQAVEGSDIYIGWKCFLDMAANASTNAVFQWKAYGDEYPMEQNYPIVLSTTSNGYIHLMHYAPGKIGTEVWKAPLVRYAWNNFVLRIKVSRDGTIGFMELWYNGIKQLLISGSKRYYGRTLDAGYVDPKWGVYGGDAATITNYVSRLKIAGTYAEAAPFINPNDPVDPGDTIPHTDTTGVAGLLDITDNGGVISAQYASSKSTENYPMVIDNNSATKYYIGGKTALWLQYKSTVPAIVTRYTLTSANDREGRDPKNWQLLASNDGAHWDTLDVRAGETFPTRFLKKTYAINNNNKYYLYYRLNITANNGDTGSQLAEWELFKKQSQSIAFDSLPDKVYGGEDLPLVAVASSDLPVSFTVVSGPASITEDDEIHVTGTGTITIRASQAGNNDYEPAADVDRTFTVYKQLQAIVFDSIPDKTYGDAAFMLNAVASSSLPVSFSVVSGPVTIDGNTVTITGTGAVTIRASQAGNDTVTAAQDVDRSFVVNKKAQQLTFDAIRPSLKTATVSLTATASSGLPVAYTVVSGPGTITGNQLKFTDEGQIVVQASQPGDSIYAAASPVTQTAISLGLQSLNGVQLLVYPNPTRGPLKVKLINKKAKTYSFLVIDRRGNIAASAVIPASSSQQEVSLDITGKPNDIYSLHVTDGSDNTIRLVLKL
ncbi:MAG: heparin lyase I family protein [Filimonas sp.]|nr:heparin lyase I family protein [Filimonas sp.]